MADAKEAMPWMFSSNVKQEDGEAVADEEAVARRDGPLEVSMVFGEEKTEVVPEVKFTSDGTTSTKARRIARVNAAEEPVSHRMNSHKEELCTSYVNNFVEQFEELFPERKKLLLYAKNE